jgi:hypothetical protein
LALGEARSVHVEARADDHTVHFGTRRRPPRWRRPITEDYLGRRRPPLAVFEGWRVTPETIALYTSKEDNVGPADLVMQLRATWLARMTTLSLVGLNLAAAAAVLAAPEDDLYVERLALLIVPTTLAATLLLAREQSALAARIQIRARVVLLATLLVLWMVMLAKVIQFHASTSPTATGHARVEQSSKTR